MLVQCAPVKKKKRLCATRLWDEGDGRGGQTGRFPLFFVSAQMPFNPPQLPFDPYFRPFAVKHLTSSLRCAILPRVHRIPSPPSSFFLHSSARFSLSTFRPADVSTFRRSFLPISRTRLSPSTITLI